MIANSMLTWMESLLTITYMHSTCEHVDFGMVQFYIGSYSNPVLQDNASLPKWGFYHWSNGEIVVPPIYEAAAPFYRDRARVKMHGKYGFIDPNGDLVVDLYWDDCERAFRDDLCPVKRSFLWGYIDSNGKVIVEPRFEIANHFERMVDGSYIALVMKDGKYGYLNDKGDYIFEPVLR